MATPKLLFRGTCAISVWTSYLRALAELKSAKNAPPRKKIIPPQAQIDRHMLQILKCGPLYRESRISVTSGISEAFRYSLGYRIIPSDRGLPGPARFMLRNREGWAVNFSLDPTYVPQAVINTLTPICSSPSSTPGAILAIDGEYLAREGFIPEGFSSAGAVYCPWRAVRGVLLVDQGTIGDNSDAKITGYIFRDGGIQQDIRWYLRTMPDAKYLMPN
jgi:hypothetical protein